MHHLFSTNHAPNDGQSKDPQNAAKRPRPSPPREAVGMVLLGSIVGGIVLAVFLPMTALLNTVQP